MKFAPLVAAGLLAAAGTAAAADFSDTWIGFRKSNSYTEPGIAADVPKNIYTIGHFSGYKYGTNFFALDILKSLENDPARGGGGQAQELYAVYRSSLSSSKVLGMKYDGLGRLIEAYRYALIENVSPPLGSVGIIAILAIVCLAVGYFLFKKMEGSFADYI